jgi:hypothetical protein
LAKETCSKLEGAEGQKLLESLQRDRAGLEPDCILYALNQLGDHPFPPAVKTLVGYLDTPPWTNDIPGIPHEVTAKTMFFPAVVAVAGIGKPAVPALMDAIGGPDLSEMARKNAVQALQFIHSGEISQAIGALVRESRAAKDTVVSARLLDTARETAARCPDLLKDACQRALTER